MNEYWIDCGETCHQETKKDFYKSIDAGFRGFILYPSGKTFWINNKQSNFAHKIKKTTIKNENRKSYRYI